MVLSVGWDRFAQEVKDRLEGANVYATAVVGGCRLTAALPEVDFLLRCEAPLPPADALAQLAAEGIQGAPGEWAHEAPEAPPPAEDPPPWIAAVSYRTREAKPGCWVDAYPEEPKPALVLETMYEEFLQTGELKDVSFEDFMRLAVPNVAILSPAESRRFAMEKGGC